MSEAMNIVKKMLRGCGELFCSRKATETYKFEKKVFKCKDETIMMEKYFLCLKKNRFKGGFIDQHFIFMFPNLNSFRTQEFYWKTYLFRKYINF